MKLFRLALPTEIRILLEQVEELDEFGSPEQGVAVSQIRKAVSASPEIAAGMRETIPGMLMKDPEIGTEEEAKRLVDKFLIRINKEPWYDYEAIRAHRRKQRDTMRTQHVDTDLAGGGMAMQRGDDEPEWATKFLDLFQELEDSSVMDHLPGEYFGRDYGMTRLFPARQGYKVFEFQDYLLVGTHHIKAGDEGSSGLGVYILSRKAPQNVPQAGIRAGMDVQQWAPLLANYAIESEDERGYPKVTFRKVGQEAGLVYFTRRDEGKDRLEYAMMADPSGWSWDELGQKFSEHKIPPHIGVLIAALV